MEAYEAILARRSVRKYTEEPISDELIEKLLTAAMSAPSCANTKDTAFLVIRDKEKLAALASCNGRPSTLLLEAPAGIIVCGDLNKAFPRAKDYCVVDACAATENILIAAVALGLGAVWLGTWPQMERVEAIQKEFNLPENILPVACIGLGHPAEAPEAKSLFDPERAHYENW